MTTANKDKMRVEFEATIPPCAGAVDFHGDSGTRLKLDIPESNVAEALRLPAYFLHKRLRVVIEVAD